ncbi:MAG: hotdog fold thioesterase [Novosphingobium sp.]|nr:hotdog fold thioesterase [Novosphingobium sp.]
MIWFGGQKPSLERLFEYNRDTLQGWLGMEPFECGDDFLTLRMPVDKRTHQPFGRLHGGASVALAETAASMAATHCVDPEKFVAVGVEINANHVRPAYSGWVYGTARPETLGRTLQVWSIRIEDEEGRLVCISRFTAAVIPIDRK